MRTHYVLIDYENVQPSSLVGLDAEHFRVLVFVGAKQNKLTIDTASALQKLGSRAEYVKIAGNGSNALDFHIAFHIGHLAAHDPTAVFHIISKDTGFDPLILHLKERNVSAFRCNDVTEIPLLKTGNSTSTPAPKAVAPKRTPERIDVVITSLRHQGISKPRTLKTLTSTINALFQKKLTNEVLAALLKELQTKGFVTVNGTKVIYALPK